MALLERPEIGENLVEHVLPHVLAAMRTAVQFLASRTDPTDASTAATAARAIVSESRELLDALKLEVVWDLLLSLARQILTEQFTESRIVPTLDAPDLGPSELGLDALELLDCTLEQIGHIANAEVQRNHLPKLLHALVERCRTRLKFSNPSSPSELIKFIRPLKLYVASDGWV